MEQSTENLIKECMPILNEFLCASVKFDRAHKEFKKAYTQLEEVRPIVAYLIKRVDALVKCHFDRLEIVKICSESIKKELKNISEINQV